MVSFHLESLLTCEKVRSNDGPWVSILQIQALNLVGLFLTLKDLHNWVMTLITNFEKFQMVGLLVFVMVGTRQGSNETQCELEG